MRLTERDAERFRTKVDKTPGVGGRGKGYGCFSVGGVVIDAHRVAFRLGGGNPNVGCSSCIRATSSCAPDVDSPAESSRDGNFRPTAGD